MKKHPLQRRPKPRPFEEKFSAEGEFFGSREKKTRPSLGRLPHVLLGMLGGVAVVGLVLIGANQWRVTSVTTEAGKLYTAAVVEEYTGLKVGDPMLGFDKRDVVKTLKAGLPLLDDIKIRRQLNGSVTVSFNEITEVYYTRHNLNYYLMDAADREVLGVFSQPGEARRVGAVYVGLPESARMRVGEPLSFIHLPYEPDSAPSDNLADYEIETDEAEVEYAYVTEFIDTVMASPLSERVTGMELGDRYDLWMVLDRRIKLRIGNMDELERKLNLAVRTLAEREEAGGEDGSMPVLMDVSDPSRIIYRMSPDIVLPDWAEGLPE